MKSKVAINIALLRAAMILRRDFQRWCRQYVGQFPHATMGRNWREFMSAHLGGEVGRAKGLVVSAVGEAWPGVLAGISFTVTAKRVLGLSSIVEAASCRHAAAIWPEFDYANAQQ